VEKYDPNWNKDDAVDGSGTSKLQFGVIVMFANLVGFVPVPLLVWGLTSSKLLVDQTKRATFHVATAAVLFTLGSVCLKYWGRFWDPKGDGSAGIADSTNNELVLAAGVGLFVACYGLASVHLLLGIRCARPHTLRWQRSDFGDKWIISGFLLIVLPFCLFLSCLLPSLFVESGSIYRTVDPDVNSYDGSCGKFGGKFGAYYLCLFWDVLIWYVHLYALCLVALIGKYCIPFQRIMSKSITPLAVRSRLGFWSIGELGLVFWFFSLMTSTYVFWLGHDWSTSEESDCITDKNGAKTTLHHHARIWGLLSCLILSLLAMPTARSSVWSKMLGVSWEAMQGYHAALGYSFMLASGIHQALWWAFWSWQKNNLSDAAKNGCDVQNYGQVGHWPRDILYWPLGYHGNNWTNSLIQIVWWSMLVCMGGFALNVIRRKNFELFYYTHHMYMAIYIGSLWHANNLWYFLISGLGIWFTDRLIRFSRGCSVVGGLKVAPVGHATDANYGITEVEITTIDGLAPMYEAGQYAFINIPEISTLQWHPFTIASGPSEGVMRFYIKAMGPDTWTHNLHQLACASQHSGTLPLINVDSPYGLGIEWGRYKRLVMIFGGIGVTPGLSILNELHHRRASELQCPAQTKCIVVLAGFEFLDDSRVGQDIARVQGDACTVRVHATRSNANHDSKGPTEFTQGGRPDLSAFMALGSGDDASPRETLVFVCGPDGMVSAAHAHAVTHGFDFHTETFAL